MDSGGTAQAAAQPFQPQNQPAADQGAINGVNQLQGQNFALGNQGQLQNTAGAINSGASTNAAGSQSAANQLVGQTQSLVPYATQTLQTAFDPQTALYNQQFQQNTDQTRAAQAAQGVAGTPYGAGGEAQSDQTFNTNWQNQQLARQTQGAQTAASLLGTAGGALTTGTGVNQDVTNNQLQSLITADQGGAMSNQNTQQSISDFLSYLQQGTAATNAGTQATSASNQAESANFDQNQAFLGDIGRGVGTLGNFLF